MVNQEQTDARPVGVGTEPAAEGDDAVSPEAAPVDDVEALREKLEAVQNKADDNFEKLLRAQAEQENLRKRHKRDLENAHKFAVERFVTELLPVRDSLELGLDHSNEEAEAQKLHEGMELTLKMVDQLMEKLNIREINPASEPFNPEFHQAMSTQENGELANNTVIAVMQKGYTLNDRLLRPALVIVSKRPEAG